MEWWSINVIRCENWATLHLSPLCHVSYSASHLDKSTPHTLASHLNLRWCARVCVKETEQWHRLVFVRRVIMSRECNAGVCIHAQVLRGGLSVKTQVWLLQRVYQCISLLGCWLCRVISVRVKESAHFGVKCLSTYRVFIYFVSSLLCVCVCGGYTVGKWTSPLLPVLRYHPAPSCPLCLQALLAPACLSIFVTSLKFDVSFFLLTASEPWMNELVIYTKCLIKSAAVPGINIVERLGIFAARGARLCSKRRMCLRYQIISSSHLVCSVEVWDSGSGWQSQYAFCLCVCSVKNGVCVSGKLEKTQQNKGSEIIFLKDAFIHKWIKILLRNCDRNLQFFPKQSIKLLSFLLWSQYFNVYTSPLLLLLPLLAVVICTEGYLTVPTPNESRLMQ